MVNSLTGRKKKKKGGSNTHLQLTGVQRKHYVTLFFHSYLPTLSGKVSFWRRLVGVGVEGREGVISIFQIRKQIMLFFLLSYITDLF